MLKISNPVLFKKWKGSDAYIEAKKDHSPNKKKNLLGECKVISLIINSKMNHYTALKEELKEG